MKPSDETAPSPIELLVTRALEVLESEGPAAMEALLAAYPDRAAAVRKRLRWLIDTGLATVVPTANAHPTRLGDFELLEPLGQGGMGVVYRARQLSLQREVALKIVRPEQLYFPGQQERFRREVAVIAALAHPGIVPVYAVGEENGTPYFAMERVRGASLAQVLDVLAKRPVSERSGRDMLGALSTLGADPRETESNLFDGSWPQVCLRIVREAAEALEHAHRRGIVHRDVKPSNLMVTRGGRVLWVDFGLASDVDSQVLPPQRRLTRTGLRVGTLAYMSPEQMRGERALDPRSDVFSLGVTLYEMLSSRLPFDGSSEARRSEGAGLGVPRDLRKHDARIPRDLEAVVQTATAFDPADRYASAEEFARDLGNVLEGRPVEARRVGAVRVTALWIRRHPAAAIALALAVIAPSVIAWRESRARSEIAAKNAAIERSSQALGVALADVTAQRDETEAERKRAENNLQRAHVAVDRMLSRVGGEALVGTPRSDFVRRQLLEDALELQEDLLAEAATTRGQLARHAATLHRSAAIRAELGDFEEALALLERQKTVLDELLNAQVDLELERERAIVEYRCAEVRRLRGEFELAREHALDALARFEALAAHGEPSPTLTRARARARIELAEILASLRVSEGRVELLETAVRELEPLATAPEAMWDSRVDFARGLQKLGSTPHELVGMVSAVRDPQADVRWLTRALEQWTALEAERPGDSMVAGRIAATRTELALRRMQLGDLPAAASEYDAAISQLEALTRDFPLQPMHADALASACYNRSLIAAMQQNSEVRIEHLRRAIDLYEGLAARADEPAMNHRRSHTLARAHLGDALAFGDEARVHFARALELGEPLLTSDRDGSLRRALAWTASKWAEAELEAGDAEACVKAAERMANYAPRSIDTVWAASWFARAADLELSRKNTSGPTSNASVWRERALTLLEGLPYAALSDPQVKSELTDPIFASLAAEPRYRAIVDPLRATPPNER